MGLGRSQRAWLWHALMADLRGGVAQQQFLRTAYGTSSITLPRRRSPLIRELFQRLYSAWSPLD